MKKSLTLLILLLIFANCTNNDEETSNPVVGEWKLLKAEQNGSVNTISVTDYATQNIIFNFSNNSNLNISNNNVGFSAGNYNYEFKNDYLSGLPSAGETKTLMIVINKQKWTYQFINGKMKLSLSYIDGPDLYLEKR